MIEGEVGNHYPVMTRREAAERVGLATMIALLVITGLVAPTCAGNQSGCTNFGEPLPQNKA